MSSGKTVMGGPASRCKPATGGAALTAELAPEEIRSEFVSASLSLFDDSRERSLPAMRLQPPVVERRGSIRAPAACSPSRANGKYRPQTPNSISHRVGPGVDRLGRSRRPRIGMHPHPAEIITETRLHEGAGRRVERLAGRAQNIMDNGRCFRGRLAGAPQLGRFCVAVSALALRAFFCSHRTRRSDRRLCHRHPCVAASH